MFQGQKCHYGYKQKSLLTNISFKNIIVDTLHLKLRILDKLINLLINTLCMQDQYECKGIFEYGKHANLTKWIDFVRKTCKIKREIIPYNNKNSACVTTDFNGCEYNRILKNINIMDYEFDDKERVDNLWKKVRHILENLSKFSWMELQKLTDGWYNLFIDIYSTDDVTPYIHTLYCHLHQQVKDHGDITLFNQEPVESLNDLTTREYYNSTSKYLLTENSTILDTNYLKQLLIKRCRSSFYSLKNEILYN